MSKYTQQIEVTEDVLTGTISMRCPYDEEFIKEFKQVVPYEDRNPNTDEGRGWDKTEKTWGFASEHWGSVKELLMEYFPRLRILTDWDDED